MTTTSQSLAPPFQPVLLSKMDVAFPAHALRLMPATEAIPAEFKDRNSQTKWNRLFADWFYFGLDKATFTPKAGIDKSAALGHISAIMGSFEPKHEHKEAAVAFLFSLWFDDVTYTCGKPKKEP